MLNYTLNYYKNNVIKDFFVKVRKQFIKSVL